MRAAQKLPAILAMCALAILASTTVAASSYDAKPRCDGVRLRTGPSTSYQTKVTIDHATRVTVAAEVAGAHWSTICAGSTYAGSKWARVIAVDGVSVENAYGIKSLYTALGLLKAVAGATTSPTTPGPSAAPTVAPPTAPPTAEPTPWLEPSSSPAAPSATSPSASAATSPNPSASASAASGSSSTFGSPGGLVVLVLALVSVFLAGFALGDHWRRDRSIKKVPSSRLDDVLH